MNVAPGWYPNPDGSQTMAFWDGRAWTSVQASAASGPAPGQGSGQGPGQGPAPSASPALRGKPPRRSSRFAVLLMFLAFAAWIGSLLLPAVYIPGQIVGHGMLSPVSGAGVQVAGWYRSADAFKAWSLQFMVLLFGFFGVITRRAWLAVPGAAFAVVSIISAFTAVEKYRVTHQNDWYGNGALIHPGNGFYLWAAALGLLAVAGLLQALTRQRQLWHWYEAMERR